MKRQQTGQCDAANFRHSSPECLGDPAVNDVDQLFLKWQGWIKNELSREFSRLLRDQRIFNAFLESLNPYAGQQAGSEIAEWMGLNYFISSCVAIRRLDDRDKRTVSLRVLLIDLQSHADIITEAQLAAHNSMFRVMPDQKQLSASEVVDLLKKEIELLDRFGHKVKQYVDKFVAHSDATNSIEMIPDTSVLDKALFSFHAIFRKYAFLIAGIPCDFKNPNPVDLIGAPGDDYRKRLTRLWTVSRDDE